jgi:hypothetical protein
MAAEYSPVESTISPGYAGMKKALFLAEERLLKG